MKQKFGHTENHVAETLTPKITTRKEGQTSKENAKPATGVKIRVMFGCVRTNQRKR